MSKEFAAINFENTLRERGTLQRHRKGVYTEVVDCTLASKVARMWQYLRKRHLRYVPTGGKTMQTAGQSGFRCICPIEAFTERTHPPASPWPASGF